MFSNHVSKQLSAYWNGELPSDQTRRTAEHLIGCTRCRVEFEEIKFGAELAKQMPLITAPDSIWAEIETNLQQHPEALPNGRASDTLRLARYLKPSLAFAAGFVLLFIAGVFLVRHRNEARPSWEVARLNGAPRINANRINDTGKLAVGQWLETDDTSSARIDIGNVGQVEVDPNTRVRLVATQPTEHRLELARGRMSARISAPPKLFFVNTPSAVAEDLGCAYTLEVDDAGNSLLRVTLGWVALQLKDRESLVPAGAACATRPGVGPGTPYFEDASELFRTAVAKLDFEPNDTQWSKIPALDIVLHQARPRDTMTLWYLLSRVDENDRARVYTRMAELVPPPVGVTREGVLRLDQEMLKRWRDRIDSECLSAGGHARFSGKDSQRHKAASQSGVRKINLGKPMGQLHFTQKERANENSTDCDWAHGDQSLASHVSFGPDTL